MMECSGVAIPMRCVWTRNIGITIDLEFYSVVRREQRKQNRSRRMIPEVRRQIPDPKSAVRGRVVGKRFSHWGDAPFMAFGEAQMFSVEFLRRKSRNVQHNV